MMAAKSEKLMIIKKNWEDDDASLFDDERIMRGCEK